MSETNQVLVYGTLRQGEGNHGVMQRANGVLQGTLYLDNFRMWTLHGGFPGVEYTGNEDDAVFCELYSVDNMDVLDMLEGYDAHNPDRGLYNRMEVDTELGKAWVYTYNGRMYGDEITDWVEKQ